MGNISDDSPITDAEIQAALARVLQSRGFSASKRLQRFLEFTVGSFLSGKADELKETFIGVHVYDRRPTYEKSEDTIVRTEARRLRNKLQEYYQTAGQSDPILLEFRTGTYVPAFVRRILPPVATQVPEAPISPGSRGTRTKSGVLIAVLPLNDLSGSTLSARCARMLTEELAHGWMHVEGTRVVSLEALPPLLHAGDALAFAQRQGARFIMSGSVWEESGCLRVMLRWISSDGYLVWSQRFDAAANLPGLHLLTERLASALISRLRLESSDFPNGSQAVDDEVSRILPTLYEAEAVLDDCSVANLQTAATKFQEILRTAPDFARALSGLANCYSTTALYGVPESRAYLERAAEASKRGFERDGTSALLLTAQAYIHMLGWAWRDAEATFLQSLALREHATTFQHYGHLLIAMERFDEAEFFIGKAQCIDPFSGKQRLVRSLFYHFTRRDKDLQEYVDELATVGSVPAGIPIFLAYGHIRHRRYEDARRLTLDSRKRIGAHPGLMTRVAEVLALCGDTEQALQIAEVFKLFSPSPPVSFYRQALLLLALNRVEETWASLGKALVGREPEMVWLKVEPRLDPLRNDVRFASLLEQVMLTSHAD